MMPSASASSQPLADHEGRVTITGPEQADVGILGWGSTEGAALEAAEICLDRGHQGRRPATRACSRRCRSSASASGRDGMERVIVPELNVTGQFARLVRADARRRVSSR